MERAATLVAPERNHMGLCLAAVAHDGMPRTARTRRLSGEQQKGAKDPQAAAAEAAEAALARVVPTGLPQDAQGRVQAVLEGVNVAVLAVFHELLDERQRDRRAMEAAIEALGRGNAPDAAITLRKRLGGR
jgi:hypothetical protein